MNGMHFSHTKSYNITFLTSEDCISKSREENIKELNTVTNMYKARGFNIYLFHGDKDLML